MDVSERLTDGELASGDYLAASHLHRYELARRLCAGLTVLDLGCGTGYGTAMLAATAGAARGVDVDAEVIAAAREAHPEASFDVGDALATLRALGGADIDAIVMFEALEHVPDPEAVLAELARLRRESVRLVVSVPNSRAFGEENPYHLTDYGWDEARRAFAAIDGAVTLRQYLAEGSLIVADDGAPQLEGEVAALEQAEPEYANTFLCLAGFDAGQIGRATAHLNLVATPNHNRYMLELERANIRIWRENLQLARGLVGRADAAAGLLAARLEHETARRAELEAQIVLERAWRDAPRYHMVDRVAGAVGRTPGLSQLARALWRVLRRFSRGPSD